MSSMSSPENNPNRLSQKNNQHSQQQWQRQPQQPIGNNADASDNDSTPLVERNYLHSGNTLSGSVGSGGGRPSGARKRTNVQESWNQGDEPYISATNFSVGPGGSGPSYSDDKQHRKWTVNRAISTLGNTFRYHSETSENIMFLGPDPDPTKYYFDDFNDEPWTCNYGTTEDEGTWCNTSDQPGTIMAILVWVLLGYSALTVTLLAETGGIAKSVACVYCYLCALALACHAKTTFTDPGSVPLSAVPVEAMGGFDNGNGVQHAMCSQCQTFKPPFSHHCRICNRCISRMDHHCPWMNNCIGAGNLKHFLLFLIYTWICSATSLILLGWNYFFCDDEQCIFNSILVELVRVMTVLSVGSFLFTSSMIMNVCYGLMTGIGTIDRLKKKALNTMRDSDEEPIPLKDVFGIGGYWTWMFPLDPVFEDVDHVMRYSTPQRLLREQMKENPSATTSNVLYHPNDNKHMDGIPSNGYYDNGGSGMGAEPYPNDYSYEPSIYAESSIMGGNIIENGIIGGSNRSDFLPI